MVQVSSSTTVSCTFCSQYPYDNYYYSFLSFPFSSSENKPSRTELQELLGRIDGKLETITAIISFYRRDNATLEGYNTQLSNRRQSQARNRNTALNNFLLTELECTVRSMGIQVSGSPCDDMVVASQQFKNSSGNTADSISNVGDYNWASDNRATYIQSLENVKLDLERKRGLVLGALGRIDPLVGSILNLDPVVVAGIIDARKEDSWLEFQFNSEDFRSSSDYASSYKSTSASVRWGGWFARGGYSYTRTRSQQTYRATLAQSSLKAQGQLLRVHIKRPWFKPEVFDDRNLAFVSLINYYDIQLSIILIVFFVTYFRLAVHRMERMY